MGEAGSTVLVRYFGGMVGSERLYGRKCLVGWLSLLYLSTGGIGGLARCGMAHLQWRYVPYRMLWVRYGTYLVLFSCLDATRCVVFSRDAGVCLVGL